MVTDVSSKQACVCWVCAGKTDIYITSHILTPAHLWISHLWILQQCELVRPVRNHMKHILPHAHIKWKPWAMTWQEKLHNPSVSPVQPSNWYRGPGWWLNSTAHFILMLHHTWAAATGTGAGGERRNMLVKFSCFALMPNFFILYLESKYLRRHESARFGQLTNKGSFPCTTYISTRN